MTMIDKIAASVYDARWERGSYAGLPDDLKEIERKVVRDALYAMRVSSDGMVVAGRSSDLTGLGYVSDHDKEVDEMWRDLLDAALRGA